MREDKTIDGYNLRLNVSGVRSEVRTEENRNSYKKAMTLCWVMGE